MWSVNSGISVGAWGCRTKVGQIHLNYSVMSKRNFPNVEHLAHDIIILDRT